MRELPSFEIPATAALCRAVRLHGEFTFSSLASRVLHIPYGRTRSQMPEAVLLEGIGTCSSKHRLLAQVARESGNTELALVVGIYEMSEANTPGVGAILAAANLTSIPEAHCYLKVGRRRYDFTGLASGASSPFDSLLEEVEVSPSELAVTKLYIHEAALRTWAVRHGVSFERAWEVRESCIMSLTTNYFIEATDTGKPVSAPQVKG